MDQANRGSGRRSGPYRRRLPAPARTSHRRAQNDYRSARIDGRGRRARAKPLQRAYRAANVDAETMEVLKSVMKDEPWHLSWIEKEMHEIAREQGNEAQADTALARYRKIDREVYATLAADEAELMRS